MFDGFRTDSRLGWVVGVLAAVIGLVGYFVLGWRFGGDGSTISTGVGVVFAVVAVGLVAYEVVT